MSDSKETVRRLLEDGFGRGQLTALAETLSPEVVFHGGPLGSTRGTDEIVATMAEYRSAFPDMMIRVEDQIAEDDRVATRFQVSGTNTGSLVGYPPTGNSISVQVINVARVEEGVIVEVWSETDALELLDQLDLV
ncbi:MAG: ester cyclase [Acidimicrobiia bacterium]|nr:ester cyclase [Acidimicrobiia bacterium]